MYYAQDLGEKEGEGRKIVHVCDKILHNSVEYYFLQHVPESSLYRHISNIAKTMGTRLTQSMG